MDSISLVGTAKTPTIELNVEEGVVEIKGRSIPENSVEFYAPVIDWLEAYAKTPQKLIKVNIQLEYFNTSSSKCLLDVFKKLEVIYKDGSDVVINWFYEEDDEDMLEAGEDYQSIIKIPFKMHEVEE